MPYTNWILGEVLTMTEQKLNPPTGGDREIRNLKHKIRHITRFSDVMEAALEAYKHRLAKERLKALREGDEAAYSKMLEETTDEKYKQLQDETDKILKNMGIETVQNNLTKQLTEYKQPESITANLQQYQKDGSSWLLSHYSNKISSILADEMGLGKTLQTISLFAQLKQSNPKLKHLVIAPLSTLDNWVSEIEKFTKPGTFCVVKYHGSKETRFNTDLTERVLSRDTDIVITQYCSLITPSLQDMFSTLFSIKWNCVVIDEGHKLNNIKSQFSQNVRLLKSSHRVLLTGTPLQNSTTELWALLNFIVPKLFKKNASSFEDWFGVPLETEEERLLMAKRLHSLIRPFMLRRTKDEVLSQLPPKVEHTITVPLTEVQQYLYKQIQDHRVVGSLKTPEDVKFVNSGVYMSLRQVAIHPYLLQSYLPSWYVQNIDLVSGKFAILLRLLVRLNATNHKVLIFTQFTTALGLIEIMLEEKFGFEREKHYERLDGSTSAEERKDSMNRFRENDENVFFILTTRAGGQGINLQSADTVIFLDLDWNPQQDLQASARAHRIGQQNEVRIIRLLTSAPVETNMVAIADNKLKGEALAIQAGLFNQKSTNNERESLMLKILKAPPETRPVGVPGDEELNILLSRSDEEMKVLSKIPPSAPLLGVKDLPESFVENQKIAVRRSDDRKPKTLAEIASEELPPRPGRRKIIKLPATFRDSDDDSSSSSSD